MMTMMYKLRKETCKGIEQIWLTIKSSSRVKALSVELRSFSIIPITNLNLTGIFAFLHIMAMPNASMTFSLPKASSRTPFSELVFPPSARPLAPDNLPLLTSSRAPLRESSTRSRDNDAVFANSSFTISSDTAGTSSSFTNWSSNPSITAVMVGVVDMPRHLASSLTCARCTTRAARSSG
ncbi:hypothetical protein CSKR_112306 [Clonorchis sinensis]|uniref:Uncharacterized protein n=1 Tax=Clonorchis sinensis TaxID=79923 RepID=A0A419PTW6_CLOSI|nr:hypothetical protein CSKR_112306 [Clonorchis sinensis]